MSDVRYSRDEWDSALEAAELYEWDSIDTGERHGPLAQWLCDQVIDHENVGRDEQRIEAAFIALTQRGEGEFSPERLIDVLNSWRGETVDNWGVLADEYAEENGKELIFPGYTATQSDYRKWYADTAIPEGEIYVSTSVGGTLYWFDTNKW